MILPFIAATAALGMMRARPYGATVEGVVNVWSEPVQVTTQCYADGFVVGEYARLAGCDATRGYRSRSQRMMTLYVR